MTVGKYNSRQYAADFDSITNRARHFLHQDPSPRPQRMGMSGSIRFLSRITAPAEACGRSAAAESVLGRLSVELSEDKLQELLCHRLQAVASRRSQPPSRFPSRSLRIR